LIIYIFVSIKKVQGKGFEPQFNIKNWLTDDDLLLLNIKTQKIYFRGSGAHLLAKMFE